MVSETQTGAIINLIEVWKKLNFDSSECHTKIGQLVKDIRKVITADDIFNEQKPMIPDNTFITTGTDLVSLASEGFEDIEKFLWDIANIVSYANTVIKASEKEWNLCSNQ